MTFGFLAGSGNLMRFFWVSWEDFDLHRYDCIHWVAKSCTTSTYRWLFRDSLSSLRTLWSAVSNHQTVSLWHDCTSVCSARGPCNFWSSDRSRNFGSFGKRVSTLCLPEPSSAHARGSIGGSRDELEVSALLCIGSHRSSSEVHSSTKLSVNSCSQSDNSCDISLCTSFDSFFYCGFRFLWIHAAALPEALHSYLHFFLILEFPHLCYLILNLC